MIESATACLRDSLASFPAPGPEVRALVEIAIEALGLSPPCYVESIFGPARTWPPPWHHRSELTMLDPRQAGRAVRYVLDTALPSLPRPAPACLPPPVRHLLFHTTRVLWPPVRYPRPGERWFFVNGVMTNEAVALLNRDYLSELFRRDLTVIQNSTNGLLVDLLQCAVGKQWDVMTEPVWVAMRPIYRALRDETVSKVVVIAHSQGTIIAGDVLQWLEGLAARGQKRAWSRPPCRAQRLWEEALGAQDGKSRTGRPDSCGALPLPSDAADYEAPSASELAKLELYCFANCATTMPYYEAGLPWIESFGNECDLVARLGMLSTHPSVAIDGPRWVGRGAWGHLLNEHYLRPLEEGAAARRARGAHGAEPFVPLVVASRAAPARSRLSRYLDGLVG